MTGFFATSRRQPTVGWQLLVAVVVSWLTLSTLAQASSPVLVNILPRGGQRGTEVEFTLTGDRLDDAEELIFYQPGLSMTNLQVVNPTQIKVKVRIADDCSLGIKRVRVRCTSGISDLKTLMVGALPVVSEVEPNSEFTTPQPVPMNCTVEGIITNEDVDYFVVEAKQGDRISAELEGFRLCNNRGAGVQDYFFDPYIAILNEARFELASSDDSALGRLDGVASVIAPADGKYYVMVRETSFGDGNYYRCHIGNFPRPLGVVPAGGKPGETLRVTFVGDPLGPIEQEVTLPVDADPDFAVCAIDRFGIAPSGIRFRVQPLDNVSETADPNDTIAQAVKNTALPVAFNGVLEKPGDIDFFAFPAKKGQVIEVKTFARRLRSELDSVVHVFNAQGAALVGNDDGAGPDSVVGFTAPEDGEYYVRIVDNLSRGGVGFFYRIELAIPTTELRLNAAEFTQYVEPKLAIPQGNRVPLLVIGERRNFGGPLDFIAANLPPGVTLEHSGMRGDDNLVQLLLVAAPDAPVAQAHIARITGKVADPNQPQLSVSADVRQDAIMLRGQNLNAVWTEPVIGLATAVTKRVPFTLQLVEPKTPLVQNGQGALKVIATREDGFKAPIKIELLTNPPGMNSSREAVIPEGQTEALISINAAGNARVGDYKLAVRGEATVGNGPVMVASPFINFRIAASYLNLKFEQAAVELGQQTELVVNVETVTPFEGEAQVTLYGLPNKVTTETLKFNKESKELIFKVKAEADAAPGKAQNLFCQIFVPEQGEQVIHNLGGGQLRIDQPLPPKANAPEPTPMPVAQAAPMPEAPKRLSRLEQLRLEQKQRQEAQNKPAN